MPSLAQLDQAVREFIAENPTDVVTVVVDASFGHRIDPSEVTAFEEAEAAGEVVSPPAGAIGRGDAFLLRIAEKTGATVLSNDSFQEFHGEHTWLFDKGRLIGGKPVPGVGWIFMDRTPVRGAKSREVTKEAKRKKREQDGVAKTPAPEHKAKTRTKSVDRAIARATEEVVEPKSDAKARRRRGGAPPAEPVNEPLAFITFIAAHPLGSDVVGSVLEYSSHGAFVDADGARCYIPLSAMSEPPPRRAREVVTKGESRSFVVQAFDPQRRGIELALPGFARVAGEPTAETVEAEIAGEAERAVEEPARGRKHQGRKRGAEARPAPDGVAEVGEEMAPAPTRRAAAKRTAARRAAEIPAEGAVTAEAAEAAEEAAAASTARKAPAAKKASQAKKAAPAKKAPSAEKAAPAKKAPSAEKAAPAKKAPSAEKAAPAKKAPSAEKAAQAKKAPAAEEAAPAKKAAPTGGAPAANVSARKAPADRAPAEGAQAEGAPGEAAAKRAPARKAPAGKAPAKKAPTVVESPPGRRAMPRRTAARKDPPPAPAPTD
jgi:hypothetical protein